MRYFNRIRIKLFERGNKIFGSLEEKKVLGLSLSISVLNQLVSSGTNFLFGLFLLATLTVGDFGLYNIGFAISQFYVNFGNALLLTQMLVNTPNVPVADHPTFAARVFVTLTGLCILVTTVAVLVLLVSYSKNVLSGYNFFAGVSTILAAVAALSKEFFIKHAFNIQNEKIALKTNSCLAVSMLVSTSILFLLGIEISVVHALSIFAFGHFAAASFGFYLSGLPITSVSWQGLRDDLKVFWVGGKWAVATSFVYMLRVRAATIVAALLLGPIGVAKLSAAQLFVSPAVILTPALSQVLLPRAVRAYAISEKDVNRTGIWLTALLFGVAFVYSAILLSLFKYVSPLIVNDEYGSLFFLVLLFCLNACVLAIKNGVEIVVQAKKRFKSLFIIHLISAPVTLLLMVLLSKTFVLSGLIVGGILGELTVLLGLIVGQRMQVR